MQYIDHLKFYINPQIYQAEQDAKKGIVNEYDKRNVEFDYQSHMGQETGKLKSRKYVRDAIAQFYEDKKQGAEESFVVTNEQGLDQLVQIKKRQEVDGGTE